MKKHVKKIVAILLLIVLSIFSITVVTKFATSAEVHAQTIKKLDDKKMTAMELTATVAAASTAVAAIPGDSTTPIATQLSELADPLLVIVCAIYLEKFLLTTIGYLSFTYLIPAACICLMVYLLFNFEFLRKLAIKLSVFALVTFLIVPVSVKITSLIEETFKQSIHETFHATEEFTKEVEENADDEDSGWLSELVSGISDAVSKLSESAENLLSVFVDAIAVLLITTCAIPISVILFFIWLIKIIFGLNIEMPKLKRKKQLQEMHD